MIRNFMQAQAQGQLSMQTTGSDKDDWDNTFQEEFYFFYGTLMDPSTLAKVLQHQHPIRPEELCPAKIVGYSTKLWGDTYPALIDGPPGNVVHGMAYKVQSQEEVDRLIAYETDMYRIRACLIRFEGGSKVLGNTFIWNADKALLKDGAFDLKEWLMKEKERQFGVGLKL